MATMTTRADRERAFTAVHGMSPYPMHESLAGYWGRYFDDGVWRLVEGDESADNAGIVHRVADAMAKERDSTRAAVAEREWDDLRERLTDEEDKYSRSVTARQDDARDLDKMRADRDGFANAMDLELRRLGQIAKSLGVSDYIDSIGPILDAIDTLRAALSAAEKRAAEAEAHLAGAYDLAKRFDVYGTGGDVSSCIREMLTQLGERDAALDAALSRPASVEAAVQAETRRCAAEVEAYGRECSAQGRPGMAKGAFKAADRLRRALRSRPQPAATPCRGCGAPLLPWNHSLADGCKCNSPRGVNHGIVPREVCTCDVCDPESTGSSRVRFGPAASERAGRDR